MRGESFQHRISSNISSSGHLNATTVKTLLKTQQINTNNLHFLIPSSLQNGSNRNPHSKYLQILLLSTSRRRRQRWSEAERWNSDKDVALMLKKHPSKKTQRTYLRDLGENGENEGTLPS